MRIKSNQKGFSLIETVIYVALLGFIMGGGLIAVYNIMDGSGRTRESMYREQDAYFIGRKIDSILSETDYASVTISGASHPNSLNTQSASMSLVGDAIMLSRGGGDKSRLNDNLIKAEDLFFSKSAVSSVITSSFTLDGQTYLSTHYFP